MSVTLTKKYNLCGDLVWSYVIEKFGDLGLYNAIIYRFSDIVLPGYSSAFKEKKDDRFTYKFEILVDHNGLPLSEMSYEYDRLPLELYNLYGNDKWRFGIEVLGSEKILKIYGD
jgi:hypothetical protein